MPPDVFIQTESNGRRWSPSVQSVAGAALVALTLSASSSPTYKPAPYDRLQLPPLTEASPANTAPVFTEFAEAASDYERQVTARLHESRVAARDEHLPWSQDSADALTAFLAYFPKPHRPSIILTDTGNLAAIWEGDDPDRHIVLQFLAHDLVQYTLMSRRPGAAVRSHAGGRDTPSGALEHIEAMGLRGLLRA